MVKDKLDELQVSWSKPFWQSYRSSTKPRRNVPAPLPDVQALFRWSDHDKQGRPTIRNGAKFRHLYHAQLDLHDHQEWLFERVLGKGTFGVAGLFLKQGLDNQTIDSVVLKVTDTFDKDLIKARPGLTREAAIMAQTNDFQSDSILRLRQYKQHHAENYSRYYFEHCEFGTLEDLRIRYKAWNMRFPEPFLWHVFSYLAEACLHFEQGPFRGVTNDKFGNRLNNGYLLHTDLKTDNVLLGRRTYTGGGCWYPIAKVSDFGLSIITHPDEYEANLARHVQKGSRVWFPPEQRLQPFQRSGTYYFQHDVPKKLVHQSTTTTWGPRPWTTTDQHVIRPELNIWAVGAIMWTLMTLKEIHDLSDAVNGILGGSPEFCAHFDGANIVGRKLMGWSHPYSTRLFELMQQCTRMRPHERPSARQLMDEIQAYMSEQVVPQVTRLEQTGQFDAIRVYWDDSIRHLPEGDADLDDEDRGEYFWRRFADQLLFRPLERPLLCPPRAPVQLPMSDHWPLEIRRLMQKRWRAAIRGRDNLDLPSPAPLPSLGLLDTHSRKRPAPDPLDFDATGPYSPRDGGSFRRNLFKRFKTLMR